MGFSPDEISKIEAGHGPRRITLRAPIEGEVVERYAVLGQVVSPTDAGAASWPISITCGSSSTCSSAISARVAEGNTAEIVSETHPGKTFHGHGHATSTPRSTPAHAPPRVRVEVENPERLLRAGPVRACAALDRGRHAPGDRRAAQRRAAGRGRAVGVRRGGQRHLSGAPGRARPQRPATGWRSRADWSMATKS